MADSGRNDRSGAQGEVSPVRRQGPGTARWLLLALLLAVCATSAHSKTINCRVHVYHETCRGVAARSGRPLRTGVREDRHLRRLLHDYFLADLSRAEKLAAVKRYVAEKRARPEAPKRKASLLDRLLRAEASNADGIEINTLFDE